MGKQPESVTEQSAASLTPRRLIVINSISRYGGMAITMVVGFLLTPFLMRSIGKAAYGLQSLSHQALEFVTMLSLALGISYDRIAATYYARKQYDRMNATLSASLTLSLGIAAIIALATLLMALFANYLFGLPAALVPIARWVICIFGAGAVFQVINAVYRSPVFMTHRLYLNALGSTASQLLAAAIVVPLFIYGTPSIIVWVALSVGMRLTMQWLVVIPRGRKNVHQLKFGPFGQGWRDELRGVMQFGGMALIGTMGSLLYHATDSIMISNLNELGITHVANYNVAQRWYPQLKMLAGSMVWLLGPAMTTQVALKQFDALRTTVTRVVRYCFIILAYPCVCLMIQAEPFLRYWLKSEFAPESVAVMRVIMITLLIGSAGLVAIETLYACRRVRKAVMATVAGGVLNVILSITLVKVFHLGILGIAIGSLISLGLLQVICIPLFLCRELALPWRALLNATLRAMAGAAPLAGAAFLINRFWKADSLIEIFIQFAVCGVIYAPAVWLIALTRQERSGLLQGLSTGWQSLRGKTGEGR